MNVYTKPSINSILCIYTRTNIRTYILVSNGNMFARDSKSFNGDIHYTCPLTWLLLLTWVSKFECYRVIEHTKSFLKVNQNDD